MFCFHSKIIGLFLKWLTTIQEFLPFFCKFVQELQTIITVIIYSTTSTNLMYLVKFHCPFYNGQLGHTCALWYFHKRFWYSLNLNDKTNAHTFILLHSRKKKIKSTNNAILLYVANTQHAFFFKSPSVIYFTFVFSCGQNKLFFSVKYKSTTR